MYVRTCLKSFHFSFGLKKITKNILVFSCFFLIMIY